MGVKRTKISVIYRQIGIIRQWNSKLFWGLAIQAQNIKIHIITLDDQWLMFCWKIMFFRKT